MTACMYLSSYRPKGMPPYPILHSTSSTEDVAKFCQTFRVYIQAGKVMESINIPYSMVMGHLSEFIESNFYDNTLCLFKDNNIPSEQDGAGRMTEDYIIDMVFHYYLTTSLLHA